MNSTNVAFMSTIPDILVVYDHRESRAPVARFLERSGKRTSAAKDASDRDAALADDTYDLMVLGVLMPGAHGLSVCRRLRAAGSVPILMLNVLGYDDDPIRGLNPGADDYLPKPFNPSELVARMRAILRRKSHRENGMAHLERRRVKFSYLELDYDKAVLASNDGAATLLTSGELKLLSIFLEWSRATLRRAFRNLIENGTSYGQNPRVSWRASGEYVVIDIEDDGPGIPDGELENAFAPYHRLEASRSLETGGHGLGLSIARSIILEHGGTVELKNRTEGGLRAKVSLPVELFSDLGLPSKSESDTREKTLNLQVKKSATTQ